MGYINSLIKGSDYFATKAVAAFSTVVSSTGVFAIASNKIFEIIQQNNTNHAAQFVQKVTIAAVGVNYLTILFTGTGIRVVRRSCGCGCGCDCCGAAKQVSKVSSEVIHFTTDLFGGCLAEIGVAIAVNFLRKISLMS
ncbi:MAG: hypothetical protein HWD61_07350 [Parachlamydiaceae bacterium]|nr:MAG: hypothetical protein HWD61_07350 [Parachlamydiaceae bacterium]